MSGCTVEEVWHRTATWGDPDGFNTPAPALDAWARASTYNSNNGTIALNTHGAVRASEF